MLTLPSSNEIFPGDIPAYVNDPSNWEPLPPDQEFEAAALVEKWERNDPRDAWKHEANRNPDDGPYIAGEWHPNSPWAPQPKALGPLVTVTPEAWRGTNPPEQKWLVTGRIPVGDVTILAGNGGSGKTEIAVQLAVAVAADFGDWLGAVVDWNGGVLFLSCEEPEDNVRDRVERIAKHRKIDPYGIGRLHLYYPDLEATALATANLRTGKIEKTTLVQQLELWMAERRPVCVIIDSIAAVFDGDAIARRQVRQFLAMLRKLAREFETAIVLLDHPSVRGMADGSGTANSVDWRNSVRSMLHLSDPEKDDPDVRDLELKKSNRGRVGEKVKIRWNGLTFAPEGAAISAHQAAAERQVDDLFLRLLDKFTAQGREVRESTGNGYAPGAFADDPEAKAAGVKARAFASAMARLFNAGHIITVQGKRSKHIERLLQSV